MSETSPDATVKFRRLLTEARDLVASQPENPKTASEMEKLLHLASVHAKGKHASMPSAEGCVERIRQAVQTSEDPTPPPAPPET